LRRVPEVCPPCFRSPSLSLHHAPIRVTLPRTENFQFFRFSCLHFFTLWDTLGQSPRLAYLATSNSTLDGTEAWHPYRRDPSWVIHISASTVRWWKERGRTLWPSTCSSLCETLAYRYWHARPMLLPNYEREGPSAKQLQNLMMSTSHPFVRQIPANDTSA
jgi:hypothetical protein